MDRYIIYEGSDSGHCCVVATVMDSTKPTILQGEHYERKGVKCYEAVCECFSMEDAGLVCKALNAFETQRQVE